MTTSPEPLSAPTESVATTLQRKLAIVLVVVVMLGIGAYAYTAMVNPNETRSGLPREIVPMSASVTMRNGVFRLENTSRERWTHVRLTVNEHFVCDFDNVGQIAPTEYA